MPMAARPNSLSLSRQADQQFYPKPVSIDGATHQPVWSNKAAKNQAAVRRDAFTNHAVLPVYRDEEGFGLYILRTDNWDKPTPKPINEATTIPILLFFVLKVHGANRLVYRRL